MSNNKYFDEMKENAEYFEKLSSMSDEELNYELRCYLSSIDKLNSTFSTHRSLLFILKTYIERGMLSSNFESQINHYIEEAIYEKSYLNNLKYIIKKMLKNKKYIDVDIIYIDITYLNYINYCRGEYINSLYRIVTKLKKVDTVYYYDNDEILGDISCSVNKLFKKIKKK